MVLNDCEKIVSSYLSHLHRDFETSAFQDACLVTTPFLRPDGEGIELEVQSLPNGRVTLSDMGNTLGYLYVNGLTLSRTLMANIRAISKAHGVLLQRNRLHIEVDTDSVGMAMHGLIQATLAASDLIHKRRPTSNVRFDEEVESLIIHRGVSYDVDFSVKGRLEEHTIKFHVNSGRNLLIQPLSPASAVAARSRAERLAYRFGDIRGEGARWRLVAVLDDRKARANAWTSLALTPVEEYAIKWSQQDELASILSPALDRSS